MVKLSLMNIKERYFCSIDRHLKVGNLEKLTKSQLCDEVKIPLRSINRIIKDNRNVIIMKIRNLKLLMWTTV